MIIVLDVPEGVGPEWWRHEIETHMGAVCPPCSFRVRLVDLEARRKPKLDPNVDDFGDFCAHEGYNLCLEDMAKEA